MEKVLMVSYAVMVPFLGIDQEWIYVSGPGANAWAPVEYDTRKEAEEAAKIWKHSKVVEYEPG
jgi:hypothetical protein